ncbi:MAG: hypothetical protein A2046_10495 [Bacteroidetes bacterium GWA2_30_7]|nr:MAG: hypothetical protein A2046_10495 [Bacteroidetes bacterium GWA2_30_7]
MLQKKTAIWKKIIAFIFRVGFSLRYKVTLKGEEILKDKRVKLFLPNHQALIEPLILISHIIKYNEISPAVSAKYFKNSFFRIIMKVANSVPVSDLEHGNRDINVLKKVKSDLLNRLLSGTSALLYPAGQLASQGFEKIFNKQGAYNIVSELPEDILIIGVRVSGFWGSMWSKAHSRNTPDFLEVLLKGLLIILYNMIFFTPRRNVCFEFIDITDIAKQKSKVDRKSFNLYLESFYNQENIEPLTKIKYFFYS